MTDDSEGDSRFDAKIDPARIWFELPEKNVFFLGDQIYKRDICIDVFVGVVYIELLDKLW